VNVGTRPPIIINNTATVSGGGEVNTSNDTVTDNGTNATDAPDLVVAKTHTGTWTQGDVGRTFTITVSNSGPVATVGTVQVVDTLPTGLTATAITGTGWTCTLGTLTCTRNDALASAASYAPITVTVNVAANAPFSVTNTAAVSGGGEVNTSNDTASDTASIQSTSVTVTVGTSISGLSFTVDGTTYTSTQTFTWAIGSTHPISTTSPQQQSPLGPRYTFQNWTDGGAISHPVTATASVTSYTAVFVQSTR
jgi:uncharacterized repeat protein (TIGR01451 family)